MSRKISFILILFNFTIFYIGCDNAHDHDHTHPQEVITTVQINLVNVADSSDITFAKWKDIDGAGGNAPIIDTLIVNAGKTYNGSLLLLNESKTPAEDITIEIERLKNEHQFFYSVLGEISNRIAVTIKDFDTNNPPLPVGLKFEFQVSSGNNVVGNLRILLSHYDNMPKSSNPSPETDIDIQIPVKIIQ